MYVKICMLCGYLFKGLGLTATMLMFLVSACEILRELMMHAVRILPVNYFHYIMLLFVVRLDRVQSQHFFLFGTICTANRENYPILVIILRH